MSGSVDICFIDDKSIYYWIEIFKKHSVIIAEDSVNQTIAFGPATSFVLRVPDGDLIEAANQS